MIMLMHTCNVHHVYIGKNLLCEDKIHTFTWITNRNVFMIVMNFLDHGIYVKNFRNTVSTATGNENDRNSIKFNWLHLKHKRALIKLLVSFTIFSVMQNNHFSDIPQVDVPLELMVNLHAQNALEFLQQVGLEPKPNPDVTYKFYII